MNDIYVFLAVVATISWAISGMAAIAAQDWLAKNRGGWKSDSCAWSFFSWAMACFFGPLAAAAVLIVLIIDLHREQVRQSEE